MLRLNNHLTDTCTDHVTFGGELVRIEAFHGHPLDRQGALFVLYCVVILLIDVSCQPKVCNLHKLLTVNPAI